ncbi:SDR family oxidoreductase [Kineosporia sp. NBRC 101731]|uniref:SDR family oxidoreductase n=1 Tax=Kineosporia sp. NBRC 101731 TaxID=3032199 RepID=UPI00249FD4F9|nr:SDR family oxidoreductase [Kineosporia sp. NBRC 101731]GLY29408.1 short-chain dehydrogenase/reductase [Kineosporia sp. NBRC 101731]
MSTRTWMITGASGGFGRLMTQKLLERGDTVIGAVRRPQALDDLIGTYGPQRLRTVQLDLTDAGSIRAATDAAFAAGERIDVVVSNAGHGTFGAAEELTDEQIERVIGVNLLGSIHLIRAALPHLRAQGGGRVLQVASEGGSIAYPNFSAYHASKWGIEGFVESVRQEVAPFGIDFTVLEPGPSQTGFGDALDTAPASPAYDQTPSGDLRRMLQTGEGLDWSDPGLIAEATIAVADVTPAPVRLALGRGAYAQIHAALESRLAELQAQREISESVTV